MAKSYPIMLNLTGRVAVVVGGGAVGRRKAEGLLAAGANVRGVDPTGGRWPSGVEAAVEAYRPEHLTGAALVFACTDDRAVNARVAADAKVAGVWVSVADDPEACDFTAVAVHRTDAVTVAVATAAGAPTLAAMVRDQLAEKLPAGLDRFASAVAAIREQVKVDLPADARSECMRRVSGPQGWEAFEAGGEQGLVDLLGRIRRGDL